MLASRHLAGLLLTSCVCLAHGNGSYYEGIAVGGPGVVTGNSTAAKTAQQAVIAAGRQPNATNVVSFSDFNGTLDASGSWSFRVNVTDFAVPNNASMLGMPSADYSEGFRMINSQWQLGWPSVNGNDSFGALLEATKLQAYFSFWRPTVGDYGNFNNQSGGCPSVLGSTCASALQQAAASSPTSIPSLPSACTSPTNINWGTGGGSGPVLSNTSTMMTPDDTLLAWSFGPYTTNETEYRTEYEEALTAVNVLIVAFSLAGENGTESGLETTPILVCNVVEKSAAAPSGASANIRFGPGAAALVLLSLAASVFML